MPGATQAFRAFIPPPVPHPDHVRIVGGGNWLEVAMEFFALLVRYGSLSQRTHLLDLGCGFGRIAIPLAYYLGPYGRYEGIDVNREMTQWATANISPINPVIHFAHADVYNAFYGPGGRTLADSYRFPFDDQSFDLVLAASVFTHLAPRDVRHYLAECQRVLKVGGILFSTWFLLTPESRGLIESGKSSQAFTSHHGEYATRPGEPPEHAVAYDLDLIRTWANDRGFEQTSLLPGSWCGRHEHVTYQDIVLLKRRDPV